MRRLFYSCAIMALMASCSSDDEMTTVGDKFAGEVKITAEAYEFDGNTRTSLTNTGSAISFAWDDDETIGIFPIAPTTNIQAKQKLDNGSNDGLNSKFDGAGWALLRGNTYAAYYPYQNLLSETPYTAIPVDMTGQEQNGNASLAHIGEGYDYMYAVASIPTGAGSVGFDFKHIGSIVMLELTMPDAGEWKNLTLTAGSKVFISKATMNVSDGSVTATEKSKSISLALKNISTTSAKQTVTLYMAVLPTTTGEVKVVVTDASDKEYTAMLTSKTVAAGKAYKWTASTTAPSTYPVSGEANGHEYVDLGIRKSMYDPSITSGSSDDRRIVLATCNIGANSPEEYGYYFRWGELCGWEVEGANSTTHNISLSSSNCKQIVPSGKSYAKETYASNTFYSPSTDNTNWALYGQSGVEDFQGKTNLTCNGQVYGDAARYNWGGDWMMMNLTQLELFTDQSLSNYTATRTIGSGSNSVIIKYTWTTQNGVYGMKLENESLGTSVFFPSSGSCHSGYCYYPGSNGFCSTSTPYTYDYFTIYAYCLDFRSSVFGLGIYCRFNGFPVRPLLELAL